MRVSTVLLLFGLALLSSCQQFKSFTYQNRAMRNEALIKRKAESGYAVRSESSKNNLSSTNYSEATGERISDSDRLSDNVQEVYVDPNKILTPFEYIDLYKRYAIMSMQKKGVPASITLAQGLLESGVGNSRLAKEANNHFGVKCGGTWDGPFIRMDDDAKNECFRQYQSVLHSYEDHGDFLRSRTWYKPLFELKITDYKGWAYGLKKAGYATDPKYPRKLIDIIEKYDLNRFDKI
ncbi:glucosaminidase domain-containing protein [Limibacter armeniacum]|uniref:glycoside hydrolase family 73 protein n=1 Tax=Limibacter armeniacum TaxID=466084 RepID=UPI002FE5EC81